MTIITPGGWIMSPLGDVVDKIVGGGTPSKSVAAYFQGDIPWMTVKDMNKLILKDTVDHISKEAVENSSTNIIPAGTAIIATRMSLGKVVRAEFDSAINQDLKAIFFNAELNSHYFEYWYRSQADVIQALGTGTTVKGIRLEVLKALNFPLPPAAEQTRIVDKLDQLLAQVDTLKARVDAIPSILKKFRQSVLTAAVSGQLTEEWRTENHTGAWESLTLADVVDEVSQGWSPKCINVPVNDSQWGVIKTSAVQKIEFVEKENKRLPDDLGPREHLQLLEGDILTTRAGPRVRCGVTCYVGRVTSKLMICDKVYRYRVAEDKGLSRFLVIQLNSLTVLERIEELKTGISESGMNLTQTKFKALELEWPKIKEQAQIVKNVEQLFAFADQIESKVAAAQKHINHITQSILAKAFRGELVPQDPNDEPAYVLLNRIKSEREILQPKKKTKKTDSKK